MELPRIDVIANSNPRGISVLIREHALSSIAPIVEYFFSRRHCWVTSVSSSIRYG